MKISSAIVLLLSTLPVEANWQYTRWGMTLDEVRAANSGVANLSDRERSERSNRSEATLLGARYTSMRTQFYVYFGFSRSDLHLMRVSLEPVNDEDCSGLKTDLKNTYGEPSEELRPFENLAPDTNITRWLDRGNGNVVDLVDNGKDSKYRCELGYRELRPPGTKGGL